VRRQFLRVYLGIALVLVLAAAATMWLVEREFRVGLSQRFERAMVPRAAHIKERLLQVEVDQRRQAAEDLQGLFGFNVELRTRAQLELADAVGDFAGGEPAIARTDSGRIIAVDIDGATAVVIGPFERRFRSRGERERQGDSLWWRFRAFREFFLIAALLGILVVIGVAVYLLLYPYERRIVALTEVARDFGAGKLESRAVEDRSDAIGALALTFNDMAGRIGGLIERQRELLHAVSHEFRTPLARLFFLLDDAQSSAKLEEKDQYLGRIEGSLQDLNDLVEELLAFVRLEEGGEQIARETVDIASQVADVALVVADLRGEIDLQIDCQSPEVMAVPHLFKRAVLNLATNAIRHAQVRVDIRIRCDAGFVEVIVDDDGPGIPVEVREQVFQPFFRVDESRHADSGGFGLGLAIVQRIMAVHDGRVIAGESGLGGARFTLYFPTV
jgi:signal transduction histidine kinase